jgi:hypothetical protein
MQSANIPGSLTSLPQAGRGGRKRSISTALGKRWPSSLCRAQPPGADLLLDPDIDPALLTAKRIAILRHGNEGRAQALNLKARDRPRGWPCAHREIAELIETPAALQECRSSRRRAARS